MPITELQRFAFPVTGQHVRSVVADGNPWFVGRDAAMILAHTNTRKAIRDHVPAHHRRGNESFPLSDLGLDPQTVLISEAGLYRLIMRSQTEIAEQFQEWVTAEVLPAIRRTGSYSLQPQDAVPSSFAEALELAAKQARELEAKEAHIAALEPGAARAERLAATEGHALVGTVAKRFGLKENRLRAFLHLAGLLIEHGSRRNEPMARYIAAGYFDVTVEEIGDPSRSVSVTKVTPKGERYIWQRLYDAGQVHRAFPPWQPTLSDVLEVEQ